MTFLWFCAAGYSFPLGCLLLAGNLVVTRWGKRRISVFLGHVTALLGWTFIGLATMSIPVLIYAVAIGLSLVWHIGGWYIRKWNKPIYQVSGLMYFLSLIVMLLAFRQCMASPVFPKEIHPICVIGDSVSAGIGGHAEKTWPLLLAQESQYKVLNLAESGATVHTALQKQIPKVPGEKQLVLLEIGGNDLFGPTPIHEFQHDLNMILTELKGKGDVIAMFELPVLPWQWSYSRVQRRLASQHDVILIPKRVMVSIFSQKETTSDLAHLTPKGHQLMAKTMQKLLAHREEESTP